MRVSQRVLSRHKAALNYANQQQQRMAYDARQTPQTANAYPFVAAAAGGMLVAGMSYMRSGPEDQMTTTTTAPAVKDSGRNTVECASSAPGIKAPKVTGVGAPIKPAGPSKKYSFDEFLALQKDGERIIVAYDMKIFDVTDFSGHPGGVGRLQMANGKDLGVFWKVYTQHNRDHVRDDILAVYEIGEFKNKEEMEKCTKETWYDDSVYKNDASYPELLVNTQYPYNAEGRLRSLTDSFFTPAGRHFVRNHNAVPVVDPEEYRLEVCGYDLTPTEFTLEDLKTKFPHYDVTTVIQCNGNRREDYHYIDHGPNAGKQPAFGPPHWVAGAIGCATWSGPRLRDVLKAAGMPVDEIALRQREQHPKAINVGLLGLDQDEVGNQYCCTFPFDKAIDPFGDVILALNMNGEPIPRPYGYPVRCIVPGHAGARNCKYLCQVEITDKPCNGNSNWKQYAVHAPDVPVLKIMEFDKYKSELVLDPPVQEMPVQSMITCPSAGDIISVSKYGKDPSKPLTVKVKGIAWGGGGSAINRLDVSLDGGQNFTSATLLERPIKQRRRSEWAWQFFEKEIEVPQELREKIAKGEAVELSLTSKALNGAWNVQPASPYGNVNAHGCCVNHWFQVPITLCPKATCDKTCTGGDFGNKPCGGEFRAPFRNSDQPKKWVK